MLQDVKAVVWHPDGDILVSCSYDDSMKLWRESDDEWVCEQTLSGETQAFSPSMQDTQEEPQHECFTVASQRRAQQADNPDCDPPESPEKMKAQGLGWDTHRQCGEQPLRQAASA